jgi:hypothetical protein
MVVGVNGTGKTTTVAKLAHLYKSQGDAPLVCAADTFRAAAVEQLEIWARRAAVDVVRAREGADPASVVFDAMAAGKARGKNPIIVDTAGRLHTRMNLMQELQKIRRIAARSRRRPPSSACARPPSGRRAVAARSCRRRHRHRARGSGTAKAAWPSRLPRPGAADPLWASGGIADLVPFSSASRRRALREVGNPC